MENAWESSWTLHFSWLILLEINVFLGHQERVFVIFKVTNVSGSLSVSCLRLTEIVLIYFRVYFWVYYEGICRVRMTLVKCRWVIILPSRFCRLFRGIEGLVSEPNTIVEKKFARLPWLKRTYLGQLTGHRPVGCPKYGRMKSPKAWRSWMCPFGIWSELAQDWKK